MGAQDAELSPLATTTIALHLAAALCSHHLTTTRIDKRSTIAKSAINDHQVRDQ